MPKVEGRKPETKERLGVRTWNERSGCCGKKLSRRKKREFPRLPRNKKKLPGQARYERGRASLKKILRVEHFPFGRMSRCVGKLQETSGGPSKKRDFGVKRTLVAFSDFA